jgi:formate hydrogenlyase subunit 6/NADH:ubiquinone oxidoreductase subunit I
MRSRSLTRKAYQRDVYVTKHEDKQSEPQKCDFCSAICSNTLVTAVNANQGQRRKERIWKIRAGLLNWGIPSHSFVTPQNEIFTVDS